MFGDNCIDDREKSYVEWDTNNILKEDDHPVDDIARAAREVGIDVDSVM